MKNLLIKLLLSSAIFGIARNASASILTPTNWIRSSAGTTYGEWNVFNSPTAPNSPDVAGAFDPNGTQTVTETSGGSFITSGGNLYSFSVPLQLNVIIPQYGLGAGSYTTVMFQTRTLGTEADYDNVKLVYNDGSSDITILPVFRIESDRIALGGFGGSQVDVAYLFQVPYSPASLKLQFPAAGSSMSLDVIAVDTITTSAAAGFVATPVPEPASLGLLCVMTGAMLKRRRARA